MPNPSNSFVSDQVAESFFKRYQTLINAFFAAGTVLLTWYVSASVSGAEASAQVKQNTVKISQLEASLEKVLTKEVYEIHRKSDTDRAERMEKLLLQLIETERKQNR